MLDVIWAAYEGACARALAPQEMMERLRARASEDAAARVGAEDDGTMQEEQAQGRRLLWEEISRQVSRLYSGDAARVPIAPAASSALEERAHTAFEERDGVLRSANAPASLQSAAGMASGEAREGIARQEGARATELARRKTQRQAQTLHTVSAQTALRAQELDLRFERDARRYDGGEAAWS